jgi:predicted TIM-barrel fold metal-dependent hydrolase
MIVDHQWHWFPPAALSLLERRSEPPRAEYVDGRLFLELEVGLRNPMPAGHSGELDEHLGLAAAHGVDVILNSPTMFGEVLHLDSREAAELLEFNNETMAHAQREHPDRFVGMAMLPMQDTDAALEVLDSAVKHGLRAVSMLCSIDGDPIATPATLPIFARIEEHGLPIVLHPAVRSNTSSQALGLPAEIGVGWMYHTTLAAINLIESGTLDECPNLVVLHPHLGGVLPYIAGRLDRQLGAQRSVYDYLRRNFYADTANKTALPSVLRVAIDTYGLGHILFGTDYPFWPISQSLDLVKVQASAGEAQAIFANVLPGILPATR